MHLTLLSNAHCTIVHCTGHFFIFFARISSFKSIIDTDICKFSSLITSRKVLVMLYHNTDATGTDLLCEGVREVFCYKDASTSNIIDDSLTTILVKSSGQSLSIDYLNYLIALPE